MNEPSVNPSVPAFDEARLRRLLPFEIEKTSLPGVFNIPAPPAGFDLRTATDAELKRSGFPFNRSAIDANPAFRELWNRIASRTFSPEDRVSPVFGSPRRRLHRPRRSPRPPDADGGGGSGPPYDTTWAGAVIPTGQWTGIIAGWNIPTLTQPQVPPTTEGDNGTGWFMQAWVGLNGYLPDNSYNCVQVGIEQMLDANRGDMTPGVFFEWWLPPPLPFMTPEYVNAVPVNNLIVSPGDTVIAGVLSYSTLGAQVFLYDATTLQGFGLFLQAPTAVASTASSAEWIVEVPYGGEGSCALPHFTPITFFGAGACNCVADPIFGNPSTGVVLNLETADQTPLTSTVVSEHSITISYIGPA